jgi:hypothetical protein
MKNLVLKTVLLSFVIFVISSCKEENNNKIDTSNLHLSDDSLTTEGDSLNEQLRDTLEIYDEDIVNEKEIIDSLPNEQVAKVNKAEENVKIDSIKKNPVDKVIKVVEKPKKVIFSSKGDCMYELVIAKATFYRKDKSGNMIKAKPFLVKGDRFYNQCYTNQTMPKFIEIIYEKNGSKTYGFLKGNIHNFKKINQ